MIRKIMSVLLCAVFLVCSMGVAMAATPDTVQSKLDAIEKDTYGMEQTGAIMERINRLEKDYNGTHMAGSMMARVDALYDEVYVNGAKPSKQALLNAIQWNIHQEVSTGPVQKRIADLEMQINGKTEEGTFSERIDRLGRESFGENTLPMVKVDMPANTLVKIALSEPVSTKNLKVGDKVHYHVAEDVMVDGVLLFVKGAEGEGTVTKVRPARNFGRNAELVIDFEKIKSVDGTYVDTFVGDVAKKEMTNLAMAAGASIAGIVLLGPLGVIAGAFVKGKNIEHPEGTEVFIQTRNDEMLYGVQTALTAE